MISTSLNSLYPFLEGLFKSSLRDRLKSGFDPNDQILRGVEFLTNHFLFEISKSKEIRWRKIG
jgi:hypothetical protein